MNSIYTIDTFYLSPFEWVYFTCVVLMTLAIVTMATIVHSHIWVRKGYEGHDEILELREVDRFIAHLIMWASLICTFFFIGMNPLVERHIGFRIGIEFIGAMSSFGLGSGAYIAFKKKPTPGALDLDK